MPSVAENIVEEAITETQESTDTVSGAEFGNQVEDRVKETTDELQEHFGDAAHEIVGDVTGTVTSWRQQMNELVGDEHVGDTEQEGAAGYVERGSKKMVLSKENTNLNVDDLGYRQRVKAHEDVHQNEQATAYNSQTISVPNESTGETEEVSVVGDLTEGHAIRKSGQPDGDLVPEYVEHRQQEENLAKVVGTSRIDQALQSGDTEALQREIDEQQRARILEQLANGEGLVNEGN